MWLTNNRPLLALLTTSILVWVVTYYATLSHMVSVWSNSETYKHCFFIPVICAYLVYEKRRALSQVTAKPTLWVVPPLLLIQLFFIASSILDINVFMHVSAYASFVLLVVGVLGFKISRVILFPLLYLAFTVPIGEELVPILQEVTADLSVGMLKLTPIPVFREGLYIHVPNGTFLVAEACAGIRFLIGTFSIGVLLAYLNYQTAWKRGVFILVCLVVPILANGMRAFGIMLIGYYSDMEHATGADHLVYGWFFFAFVTLLIFWLSSFGAEKEPATPKLQEPDSLAPVSPGRLSLVWLLILVPLMAPFVVTQTLLKPQSFTADIKPFESIPHVFPDADKAVTTWAPPSDDARWEGNAGGAMVNVIFVNEDSGTRELVSSRHKVFDAQKWSQKKLQKVTINGTELLKVELVNIAGAQQELIAWYQSYGFQSYSGLEMKLRQLMVTLSGRVNAGYFITAAVNDMSEEDIARLLNKFSEVEPTLPDGKD
ncbi:MAG: exosortase A [Pseudomonadota bacterium]|nr:exosortase A [Pseudomonadota bacterium]